MVTQELPYPGKLESPSPIAYDVVAFEASGRTSVFAHVRADGTITR